MQLASITNPPQNYCVLKMRTKFCRLPALVCLFATAVLAGQVRQKDGTLLHGAVQLSESAVTVTPDHGQPLTIVLEQVREVLFVDSPRSQAAKKPAPIVKSDPSTGRPAIALIEPQPDDSMRAPHQLLLKAAVDSPRWPIERMRFYIDETQIGEATSPPYQALWDQPRPGNHIVTAEVVASNGLNGLSHPVPIRIAGDGNGTFPADWSDYTLREHEHERPLPPAGHSSFKNGVFTLRSPPGELLSDESDLGEFVFAHLDGDGQITAHLARVEAGDVGMGALAGIMIRQGLSPDGRRVALLAGRDSLSVSRRSEKVSKPVNIERFDLPRNWLRLVRFGNQVRSYSSADGKRWVLVDAHECPLGTRMLAGLVVSSSAAVAFSSAAFDHVAVEEGRPPMLCPGQGVLQRDGVFLSGQVISMDDASVVCRRGGREERIGVRDVGWIAFGPVLSEAERPGKSQSGVLLENGDFVEGEIKSIRDGRVKTSSVLLGIKTFEWGQVRAIFLKPLEKGPLPYAFTIGDGSIYPAREFHIEDESLIFETPREGEMHVPLSQLREMKVVGR